MLRKTDGSKKMGMGHGKPQHQQDQGLVLEHIYIEMYNCTTSYFKKILTPPDIWVEFWGHPHRHGGPLNQYLSFCHGHLGHLTPFHKKRCFYTRRFRFRSFWYKLP